MMLNTPNIFNQISLRIIKEQALIIGPLAWEEAKKVTGITIGDQKKEEVIVDVNNPKEVINRLVAQYERLFGKLSHEICREATHDLVKSLEQNDVPSSLI